MARLLAWAFAALLVLPASGFAAECDKGQNPPARGASPASHTDGRTDSPHQPPKFWVDPKLRAELGITDQQSTAIEAIWQRDLSQRTETGARVHKLEAQLDQMMVEASSDEAAVVAQIDRVEAARTEASKARVLMLYRINKLLTPEQRTKLADKAKAMRDQRDGRGDHR
ncbi:MAG TPA: Spy/CpxP family protein refolding chaperone [Vicinamibacterales bacterium]|jgi:Spy/CpxP family protein refolding chaperone